MLMSCTELHQKDSLKPGARILKVTNWGAGITYRHWFESHMVHFQTSFPANVPGRAAEDGPCTGAQPPMWET